MSIRCNTAVLDGSLVDFLTKLVQHTQDAIVVVDAKYSIVLYNPAAEEVFDYSADEMLGHRVNKILPMHKTTDSRAMMFGKSKEGDQIPLEVSLSSMILNGHEYHAAIIRKTGEMLAEVEKYRKETKQQLLREVSKVVAIGSAQRTT